MPESPAHVNPYLWILGIELLVDIIRNPQQLGFSYLAGERIAQLAINPVKDAYASLLSKAESGFVFSASVSLNVQGQALTVLILVHELRYRALIPWQQTPADEFIANT